MSHTIVLWALFSCLRDSVGRVLAYTSSAYPDRPIATHDAVPFQWKKHTDTPHTVVLYPNGNIRSLPYTHRQSRKVMYDLSDITAKFEIGMCGWDEDQQADAYKALHWDTRFSRRGEYTWDNLDYGEGMDCGVALPSPTTRRGATDTYNMVACEDLEDLIAKHDEILYKLAIHFGKNRTVTYTDRNTGKVVTYKCDTVSFNLHQRIEASKVGKVARFSWSDARSAHRARQKELRTLEHKVRKNRSLLVGELRARRADAHTEDTVWFTSDLSPQCTTDSFLGALDLEGYEYDKNLPALTKADIKSMCAPASVRKARTGAAVSGGVVKRRRKNTEMSDRDRRLVACLTAGTAGDKVDTVRTENNVVVMGGSFTDTSPLFSAAELAGEAGQRKVRRCSVCRAEGHNKRTCPTLAPKVANPRTIADVLTGPVPEGWDVAHTSTEEAPEPTTRTIDDMIATLMSV